MPRLPRPPTRPGPSASRTSDLVLDAAEGLVQTRGFNGFSYADVSAKVGITTASLHYHFPTKAGLGRALIDRYTTAFASRLSVVAAQHARASARLEAYAQLYVDVLAAGRMCLCGMLAAEHTTLPEPMQRALRAFFDANEVWLADVLERGRAGLELWFPGSARDAARLCTSTLEGAMLLARAYGEPSRLTVAIRLMLAELRPRDRAPDSVRPAAGPAPRRSGSARSLRKRR